jgi:hypothetical protein
VAPRNIHHVRHLIGIDLVQQVDRITEELNQQTNDLTAWIDNDLLRGIPLKGGVITDSVIPGSDEHMDWFDNSRLSA